MTSNSMRLGSSLVQRGFRGPATDGDGLLGLFSRVRHVDLAATFGVAAVFKEE